MAGNKAVAYMGPGKVEVLDTDYPTLGLRDGPGVNPANVGRKVPHGRSLTATAPFHRRAEDLDWQAALLPRVRLVSGWCRARRPLNKEVWQGREERRQGRLCGSRSDLIGRQRGRSSRRYQFGAGAGS
jgi:hypothetical protein